MTNRDPNPRPERPAAIPVICDCCRASGLTGEDPFEAFGALLDFEPVPRRSKRADGWDAEVQRAYIAALSLTGSDRAACRAVGRAAFGVTQLIDHERSEGFRAAREEAFEIAADERSRRLAEGLRAVAAEQSGWRPPDPPWAHAASRRLPPPPPPEPERSEEAETEWLFDLVKRYLLKVEAERKARLAGQVVAADHYLRQLTFIEVILDLAYSDGFRLLMEFRREGHHLIDIAETPFSKMLGEARRLKWAELGEPERPEHPPRRYLQEHDGFSTEPFEAAQGGTGLSYKAQWQEFERNHRQDAEAQILWEEAARRDFERRRDSAADSKSRDAAPARPACRAEGEDTFDVTNSVRDGSPSNTEEDSQ